MMRRVLGTVLAASLAGCAVGPNYKRPEISTPDRFFGEEHAAEAKVLTDTPWFEVFGDATLKALVEEALVAGFDARIAAARVEEARARYGIAKSDFYPQIGYGAGYDYRRLPETIDASGDPASVYSADINISWEIDIWGRVRRLNEQALNLYLATEEARQGVLLTLASDVAQSYFELLALDSELEISRHTVAAYQEMFNLFERRLQGGAATALETSYALGALKSTAAQIPDLERRIVLVENRLNLLLGRQPGPVARGIAIAEQPICPEAPPGLPSTLLERRPDVRQAEDELHAANAAIGVATANFFPTISLTGLFGGLSPELSEIFGANQTWSVGAGLLGPIFQGGRLKQAKAATVAQWEAALASYEKTVTNALGEVSSALVAKQKLALVKEELTSSVTAFGEAVRIANIRYLSGLSSYFEVVNAQQQLFPVEILLARAQRDELTAIVSLYKALGGGWQPPPQNPEEP